MAVLSGLEPKEFFQYFEEISAIPRGSYHEKAISDHLKAFAEERGMTVEQDEYYNLLIKKPAYPGYENAHPLLFHGHMDMVLDQDEGVTQDMLAEGIRLVVDGDYIRADGTTLGADNGVGVAIILCILASTDLPHPPIEAIITTREEVGKVGASVFDASNVTGKRLIDFNWQDPHSIFAGCAGDISAYFNLPASTQLADGDFAFYQLSVSGLNGGHSEFDIDKERANAIVCLARIVNRIGLEHPVFMADIHAGVNRYVIPGNAQAVIAVKQADEQSALKIVEAVQGELKNEYQKADPGLTIKVEKAEKSEDVLDNATTLAFARCISLIPCGVQSMSLEVPDLVESSSTIAAVEIKDGKISILCTIPSAVTSRKYEILQRIRNLAALVGAEVTTFADCPEWPYKPDSKLLATARQAYINLFGEEPKVDVSHSSLELGLIYAKVPGIEMISLGPEIYDIHTTMERLNHKTVAPVWSLIKEILKRLND